MARMIEVLSKAVGASVTIDDVMATMPTQATRMGLAWAQNSELHESTVKTVGEEGWCELTHVAPSYCLVFAATLEEI